MGIESEQEFRYRYHERIGILCGTAEPTPEQRALARTEATQAVNIIEGKEPDPLLELLCLQ